jgi:hypothetical protein
MGSSCGLSRSQLVARLTLPMSKYELLERNERGARDERQANGGTTTRELTLLFPLFCEREGKGHVR